MRPSRSPPYRERINITGVVQGVGFRPFVYRLAQELGLSGWVSNDADGVRIEVQGARADVAVFATRLRTEAPPLARVDDYRSAEIDTGAGGDFSIRASDAEGERAAIVLPDIATCAHCRAELFDPGDRRFRYPFIACTQCGPRYSIIAAIPYDRSNTSMAAFTPCEACLAEYRNPVDRRFHAQPNACSECGPQIALWDRQGRVRGEREEALAIAARALQAGDVVALKGLGGFQLLVDARNRYAILRLRAAKRRGSKPFALMVPTLAAAEELAEISLAERRLLTSPAAPIVLLAAKRAAGRLIETAAIAPDNPFLGVMVPYTPLHHLFLSELGTVIVATSGNAAEEPICIEEHEALARLAALADLFLVHDRPILRPVDDSVARLMAGRPMVLRRARGYAPLPIRLPLPAPPLPERQAARTVLAVGAHLKSAVAISSGESAVLSQHLGSLDSAAAVTAFARATQSLVRLYGRSPEVVVSDLHPDYSSTRFAESMGLMHLGVQHHSAHLLACMADNDLRPPVLGVCWDGSGYGTDGTVWGGEFLLAHDGGIERVAHLRQFPLPGAELAAREPRRSALGVLYEMFGDDAFAMTELPPVRAFSGNELTILRTAMARGTNQPRTSSAGRLFDAAASLVGLRQRADFEGQAAMDLEHAVTADQSDERYECTLEHRGSAVAAVVDWEGMMRSVVADVMAGTDVADIASRFHHALVEAIARVALRAGQQRVALSGGCWQNKYLTERTVMRLRQLGLSPYWHEHVPPNDGGIAVGQLLAAFSAVNATWTRRSPAADRTSVS
ncbi:MAG: carbamoyltransferase HypF [Candidatus Schekmanbacteria bacterium]|nr:carbamoyltransferase HypF [Candidatus Schekmanbacteria bacterium]